jgi:hypothetical protein
MHDGMYMVCTPEMSRAEQAGRAKKTNNSHCRALRPRRTRGEAAPSGEAASWLHWMGKVWFVAGFLLYPASRVSGRGPAGLGKPKLLLPTGQTKAHGWGLGH